MVNFKNFYIDSKSVETINYIEKFSQAYITFRSGRFLIITCTKEEYDNLVANILLERGDKIVKL